MAGAVFKAGRPRHQQLQNYQANALQGTCSCASLGICAHTEAAAWLANATFKYQCRVWPLSRLGQPTGQ